MSLFNRYFYYFAFHLIHIFKKNCMALLSVCLIYESLPQYEHCLAKFILAEFIAAFLKSIHRHIIGELIIGVMTENKNSLFYTQN